MEKKIRNWLMKSFVLIMLIAGLAAVTMAMIHVSTTYEGAQKYGACLSCAMLSLMLFPLAAGAVELLTTTDKTMKAQHGPAGDGRNAKASSDEALRLKGLTADELIEEAVQAEQTKNKINIYLAKEVRLLREQLERQVEPQHVLCIGDRLVESLDAADVSHRFEETVCNLLRTPEGVTITLHDRNRAIRS